MIRTVHYNRERGIEQLSGISNFTELASSDGSVIWVDMDRPTDEEAYCLTHDFRFHPLLVEDVIAEPHAPKIDEFEDYLFVVFHTPYYDHEGEGLGTKEIDLFMGKNYVVSIRYQDFPPLEEIVKRCIRDERVISRGPEFLLYTILDYLVDDYDQSLKAIENIIRQLEKEVFGDPPKETLRKIFDLREDIVGLKQIVAPQRAMLARLSRQTSDLISPKAGIYFRDVYDHLSRIEDLADSYRELLSTFLEVYFSTLSQRTNEVMKVLTIIATIFLPLTFLVGVYGMNFQFMPELSWKYGYLVVWFLAAAIVGGLLFFFKRKGWL
jgi:magnesium transporter